MFLVDQAHQLQVIGPPLFALVIHRGPADTEQPALAPEAEVRRLWLDQCQALGPTQRSSLRDKNSVPPSACRSCDRAYRSPPGSFGRFYWNSALEDAGGVVQQVALPLTHHGWMDLEAGRDLRRDLFLLGAARATLALNSPLYCRRFLLMIKFS